MRRGRQIDWLSGPVPVVPGRTARSRSGTGTPAPASSSPEEKPAASARDQAAPVPSLPGDEAAPPPDPSPDTPGAGDAAAVLGHVDEPAVAVDLEEHWQELSRLEIERAAQPQPRSRAPYLWFAGVVLMVLSLGVQSAYIMRDDLAQDPTWRPWLETLCTVAGCELPLRRDLTAVRLVRGQVSDHPELDETLVATASLVNEAGFRQPYPLLRLSLLDNNQNISGERWFHPEDYLGEPAQRQEWAAGMPPGLAVRVRLVLEDPGSGAQQYIFDLR